MRKLAKDVVKGDKIDIAGKPCLVEELEVSDIGKHGKRKVRILAITPENEKIVIIRPDDYGFNII